MGSMFNIEELATAIDCEGYIGINRETHANGRAKYSAKVGLAMTDPIIPTALSAYFNGPLRCESNAKGNFKLFRFEMAGNRETERVFRALFPHLVVKLPQAKNAIAFLDRYHQMPPAVGRRFRTELELDELSSFWIRAKNLNKNPIIDNQREATFTDKQLAIAIDCEGHVSVRRKKDETSYHGTITLAMVHPALPLALYQRFGGRFGRQSNSSGNYDLYRWGISGIDDLKRITPQLLPLLTVKKKQIDNLVSFVAVMDTMLRRRRTPQEKSLLDSFCNKSTELVNSAPATTERGNPETGSDSLNLQATARESSEA